MTVKELTEQCPFEIVHLGNPDAVLTEPYCCDLLSIAMGNAPAGSAWCTVMSNMNTLAVAALAEASCVIIFKYIGGLDFALTRSGAAVA